MSKGFAILPFCGRLADDCGVSEMAGRRRCARMAAGLPEKKEKVRGEKRRKMGKNEGGGGKKKRRTMLD